MAALRCRLFAILCSVFVAWPSTAHTQWSQWLTIDGAFGEAVGWGGDYRDRVLGSWRLSAQARIAHIGPASVLASIEHDRVFTNGDGIDICIERPGGQCLREYPLLSGWMLGSGLRTPTTHRAVITVFAGLGFQRSTDRRRDRSHDASAAWMVHGDAALRVWRAVWLTAGARRTQVTSIYGDALHVRALTVGLRVSSQAP